MTNWQPIDQAPKDGTKVLVYGNRYEQGARGTGFNVIGIAQWGDLFPYDEGRGWINNDCYYRVNWFPEYFMPLPAQPIDSPITEED